MGGGEELHLCCDNPKTAGSAHSTIHHCQAAASQTLFGEASDLHQPRWCGGGGGGGGGSVQNQNSHPSITGHVSCDPNIPARVSAAARKQNLVSFPGGFEGMKEH